MPAVEKNSDQEASRELDRDRDRDGDREKGSKSKGPSKAKDLSHVPCKFFKVGSCTAGSSCPFSHSVPEPGQHKDVCAWFVKGNCKFGHKCALAHILPGQSMAMDRKNKKAAQAAAHANNASGGQRESGKGSKAHKTAAQNGPASAAGSGTNGQSRNPLLSGSTAPTRILHGSARAPIPMSLKATISPSAPAPPLKDTDFASFGLPDETNKLSSAPAQGSVPAAEGKSVSDTDKPNADKPEEVRDAPPAVPSPAPLPFSTPSARPQDSVGGSDLGPIGSPPRSVSSTGQPARVNGFSPGTSPAQNPAFLSTSPFSAPGAQSIFLSYEKNDRSVEFKARSGLAASLGASHTWQSDVTSSGRRLGRSEAVNEVVVEDEDLEELIPSSLTDLLTPEERSRRYSRNASNVQPPPPGLTAKDGWSGTPRTGVETPHHRYSRSVPAPSLLGDVKSIWADTSQPVAGSPHRSIDHGTPNTGGLIGLGSGTPTSFKSTSAFGGRSLIEDHTNAFLSPSNASAAFLPGIHHHYINSKSGVHRSGGTPNLRPGTYTPTPPGANAANLLARINEPPSRQPFDGTSESLGGQPFQLGRPISRGPEFGADGEGRGGNTLSPSAIALQAHAPGQSLPQGLAAGYSRIHALPPPPVIPSPSSSAAFTSQSPHLTPGTSIQGGGHGAFGEWLGMSPGNATIADHLRGNQQAAVGAFEPLGARSSYSSTAAARPSFVPGPTTGTSAAPGSRVSSGKNWPHGGTPLSPLSGPVVTGDDDDLFSMDG
ncbi:hypothetical protein DENSPDRAFT_800883 [Dentipellis sp. KUC8613]|nr:hypothetical protein DENSPDRAFT_800883 [Dentipellis sp. KUC8613]